ncbi:MAG: hypothetical protein ACI4RA_11350, partial [Kiritimatiellia bacterium]
ADDGSGTSDSVKYSYNLKTIVAHIHNHPSESKNCPAPAGCSYAWPSMTDVFSLILTNQERDKFKGDKKIPSKVDTYIVDCFGEKSVVRVDGGTGAVKNVARDGEYNPEPYNGLSVLKCNDADECGKSLKEIKSEEDLRNFIKMYGHSAYNPAFFNQMRQLVVQFPNAMNANVVGRIDIGDEDRTPKGVRGWCHCWENKKPPIGLEEGGVGGVGGEAYILAAIFDPRAIKTLFKAGETPYGLYAYALCARCGRCFTTKKPGEKFDVHDMGEITNWRIWAKLQYSDSDSDSQAEKLLREARDELLKIPDGGVVIPGECHCKDPDPVSVNVVGDKFYVCCLCGRVRLPDKTGGIPWGPTNWRSIKGEDKPFPGFNKENE